jgi:hypothetical protein
MKKYISLKVSMKDDLELYSFHILYNVRRKEKASELSHLIEKSFSRFLRCTTNTTALSMRCVKQDYVRQMEKSGVYFGHVLYDLKN